MFGTHAFKRSTSIAPHLSRVTSQQHRCRVEVAELARQKLALYAEPEFTSMWADSFAKVGQHEGCGLLLVAAEMDAPGKRKSTTSIDDEVDGGNDDGEDAHWEENAASRDAQRQVENLLAFISTAMVISGLCLSVSIPLCVASLDGGVIDTNNPSLSGNAEDGKMGPGWYRNWNTPSSRHALHWAECAFLAISVLFNFLCMSHGFMYFGSVSLYLPTVESRMRYLIEYKLSHLTMMWLYPVCGLYFLVLALPLVAARYSPASTIILAIPAVAVLSNFYSCSIMGNNCAKMQHELTREVLKRAASEMKHSNH